MTFKDISDSEIEPLVELSEASRENFNRIELLSPIISFHELNLPKLMLGDGTETFIYPVGNNSLAGFDIEKML